jgi:hypothetical protein
VNRVCQPIFELSPALAAYREVGVNRVMGLIQETATSDDPLESLAADARSAGCFLSPG